MTIVCKEGETISEAQIPEEYAPAVKKALETHCKFNCPEGMCRAKNLGKENGLFVVRSEIATTVKEGASYVGLLLKRE